MNAERLHAIAVSLNQEMIKGNTVGRMQELINALQQVVNQPHPQHQQTLSQSLKAMYASVTNTHSDGFSPTWREILREIGGEELFGDPLKASIEAVFARNQITPAVALEELQELHKSLQAFKNALDQITSALRHLHIGDEKLSPGECEIGVLIPRDAVKNHLLEFADELKELGFILNTFSEVATGKKDELAIRTISSSDLLVYLQAAAPYAACLAVSIERVVALYKQLLEIRKLREGIRKQGVPEDQTTGIETYANNLMETGIDKIAVEVVSEYHKKDDKGRKNELTNAVRISLNKIANRIDRGFNLEVRVEPLAKKNDQEEDKRLQTAIAAIQAATANMQFVKLNGQPILRLPEAVEKPKKKE
ncbi:MAG: hypothetical protein WC381_10045 [Kiritimatiellia bacterium]|jgi:hypothetical protein